MQENVGRIDRVARAFVGSAMIVVGATALGGLRGRLPGLITLIAGVLAVESAITRVCPTNHVLGIDTAEIEERLLAEG